MTEQRLAAKIAIALECMIDLEEAQGYLKARYYGTTEVADIPWDRFSRTAFSQLAPRVGILGFIQDMRAEGSQFLFFSKTDDRVLGERAELWLREWLADPHINMHQTATPGNLDAQVFFVPAGDTDYRMPAGRPRVVELDPSGQFFTADHMWALDLDRDGFYVEEEFPLEEEVELPELEEEPELMEGYIEQATAVPELTEAQIAAGAMPMPQSPISVPPVEDLPDEEPDEVVGEDGEDENGSPDEPEAEDLGGVHGSDAGGGVSDAGEDDEAELLGGVPD